MRMAKLFIAFFVVLIFTLSHAVASAEEVKIGYINLGKTLDEYERTKESEKSLEKKLDKKEKERKKLVNEIKKLKDEIVLLSKKGKKEKEDIIDEKIKNLQDFDKELRSELQQERDEALRDILREINKIIRDYGEKHGYTAILNDRVIVYGNEAIDITQDIIDILNKRR